MKKISLFFIIGVLILACSVKKDKFINRSFHSVTSEYNILYNGNLALEDGLRELTATYEDNFWEILPVERMQKQEEVMLPGENKNPNFERAEEKAVKAIQKHSMNIGGMERNPQMDEAYLLLGKARYYDNRFIPALEALNYILYKHPQSDKIYQARVWREKINIRIDNNEGAIKNLKQLLEKNRVEGQDLADANAMLTQAYLNIEAYDSAVATIKVAKEFTKNNDEKGRYGFILGQLYNELNYPDSAYTAFQEVIDLNRKTPRQYLIRAYAEQAELFDYEKGDTLAFTEKFNKLIKNRENRPYLDVLYYEMGNFYNNFEKDSLAESYYNKSLRAASKDRYLAAQDYNNIAEMYFEKANYKTAGVYLDSTLLRLDDKTREYRRIKKKRDGLVDVIRYEDILTRNDSILYVVGLNEGQQKEYYGNYIEKLKKEEEERQKLLEEQNERAANIEKNANVSLNTLPKSDLSNPLKELNPPGMNTTGVSSNGKSTFYFYNAATVSYGIKEFIKRWGNRKHIENWRLIDPKEAAGELVASEGGETESTEEQLEESENPMYDVNFYLSQLPKETKEIDSITVERNDAYYQLGLIYKEKFKEYQLAADKLETLLKSNPDERLIVPAKYNLVKIYEIIDPKRAALYKNDILTNYADSRYAEILLNPQSEFNDEENPEKVYARLYRDLVNEENLRSINVELEQRIKDYFGDENLPKFEVLHARVVGRLEGVEALKEGLNYVALTYPNSDEGKKAKELLVQDIPKLENSNFSNEDFANWKIIFPKKYQEGVAYEDLLKTISLYLENSKRTDLKTSTDVYTLGEDFVVLHGFNSKQSAAATLSLLRDYKEYLIKDEAYVLSAEDYKVVQMKKLLEEWLKLQNN